MPPRIELQIAAVPLLGFLDLFEEDLITGDVVEIVDQRCPILHILLWNDARRPGAAKQLSGVANRSEQGVL